MRVSKWKLGKKSEPISLDLSQIEQKIEKMEQKVFIADSYLKWLKTLYSFLLGFAPITPSPIIDFTITSFFVCLEKVWKYFFIVLCESIFDIFRQSMTSRNSTLVHFQTFCFKETFDAGGILVESSKTFNIF